METTRLRTKLLSSDDGTAARGATGLLELHEPSSLRDAERLAFPGGAPSGRAARRLAEAWEAFRHDRHRARN
ncbi:MAG: hypothetical protein Q7T55_24780 [Solirubrobacteraceae bacterium]|nr:hypothetical protein [Solirubrobacteraceae bacterium]